MRIIAVLAVSFMTLPPFIPLPAQAGGEKIIREQVEELKQ